MFSVFSKNKGCKMVLHFAEDSDESLPRTLCGMELGVGSGLIRDGDYRNNEPCSICMSKIQGTSVTTAAQLGRKGGQSTTPAKIEASRSNGKKGGRPARINSDAFD